MVRLILLLCQVALFLGISMPVNALAKSPAVPEAMLSFANRDIVVLRTSVQGATPEVRVKRIQERLRLLDEKELDKPLVRSSAVIDHHTGELFSIGGRAIFVLLEADLDEEAKLSLSAAGDQVEAH